MARIPENEIETLKKRISIQKLAESRGVVLRKRGDELLGLCPFHEDHSPSLVINPSKNVWHCLGACQAGGSVIDWVMYGEGCSFREAVETLRRDYLSLAAVPTSMEHPPKRGESVVARDGDAQRQLSQVIDYYHQSLKESPEAMSYLEKRGIGSLEAIERFRLGFCNRTLCLRLPEKNRKAGGEIRGSLSSIGILRKSGHEHFRGSLVIPVIDANGVITEVYGRKTGTRLRKGTPLHLYLPGPHKGVWNSEALMASDEIILCESLIDALTFWCAGFRNVTCAYGIEGFTADHMEAFLLHGIRRVYIAYDSDDAGNHAADALSRKLIAEEMECYRIRFPKGMDANEYALKVESAKDGFDLLIRNAEWIGGTQSRDIGNDVSKIPPSNSRAPFAEGGENMATPTGPANSESPFDKGGLGDFCQKEEHKSEQKAPIEAEIKPGEIIFKFGDRTWRIRGLERNMSFDSLRVNVLAGKGDVFHVDTFELYSAKHRQAFIKQASFELEVKEDVIKKDLGKLFLQLEMLQEKQINDRLKPKEKEAVQLSPKERAEALEFLKSPDLIQRILRDFEKCGIVGEHTNKLVGYLSAVSRKLEEPLAVVIQSSSAAGKSALMEAILSFLPSEEQVKYSAMTGQSLFYMGETNLKNRILAIVEEEGAERASYALKLLQSEGELTIASTGKDPATGRLVTQEYRVEGPVMIFMTTTAVEIDEELLNRCIVLTVDENREQTRAIHALQRKRQTLEGLLERRDSDGIRAVHQNVQRLLKPLLVANPYADSLTFLDTRTRTRRDHMKYLTLIRSIALLHQYQREIKQVTHDGKEVDYIEVIPADIEIANRLCHQVLGRSLDELAPQTRNLLIKLDEMVCARCESEDMDRADFWFTRREAREFSGFGSTQIKIHMHRLEELEYLIVHRGGRGHQFVYELAYEGNGKDGKPFLPGLLDVNSLEKQKYDARWSGVNGEKSGTCRPQVGVKSGGCRGADRPVFQNDSKEITPPNGKASKITLTGIETLRRTVPAETKADGA